MKFMFSRPSNRPLAYLALASCLFLIFADVYQSAPIITIAPATIGSVIAFYVLMTSRESGLEIGIVEMRVWHGVKTTRFKIEEIEAIEIGKGRSPSWSARMRNGTSIKLPKSALPARGDLEMALRNKNIALETV